MSTTGGGPAFMVEAFPKHVRCSGLSVGYNLASAIFGGTVPLLSVFLVKVTHYPLAPALYLALVSGVSLWTTFLMDAHESDNL
jgi:hypothetical protein